MCNQFYLIHLKEFDSQQHTGVGSQVGSEIRKDDENTSDPTKLQQKTKLDTQAESG